MEMEVRRPGKEGSSAGGELRRSRGVRSGWKGEGKVFLHMPGMLAYWPLDFQKKKEKKKTNKITKPY